MLVRRRLLHNPNIILTRGRNVSSNGILLRFWRDLMADRSPWDFMKMRWTDSLFTRTIRFYDVIAEKWSVLCVAAPRDCNKWIENTISRNSETVETLCQRRRICRSELRDYIQPRLTWSANINCDGGIIKSYLRHWRCVMLILFAKVKSCHTRNFFFSCNDIPFFTTKSRYSLLATICVMTCTFPRVLPRWYCNERNHVGRRYRINAIAAI